MSAQAWIRDLDTQERTSARFFKLTDAVFARLGACRTRRRRWSSSPSRGTPTTQTGNGTCPRGDRQRGWRRRDDGPAGHRRARRTQPHRGRTDVHGGQVALDGGGDSGPDRRPAREGGSAKRGNPVGVGPGQPGEERHRAHPGRPRVQPVQPARGPRPGVWPQRGVYRIPVHPCPAIRGGVSDPDGGVYRIPEGGVSESDGRTRPTNQTKENQNQRRFYFRRCGGRGRRAPSERRGVVPGLRGRERRGPRSGAGTDRAKAGPSAGHPAGAFDAYDVYGFVRWKSTNPYFGDAGAIKPQHVLEGLPEWVADGRPLWSSFHERSEEEADYEMVVKCRRALKALGAEPDTADTREMIGVCREGIAAVAAKG